MMEKIKKMLASILALTAMTFGTLTFSINVSASYQYDVNNDGYVNASDSLAITKYLSGMLDMTAVHKLDINQNYIIDRADINCLNATILGQSFQVNDAALPDFAESADAVYGIAYQRYVCSSGLEEEYTLDMSLLDNGDSVAASNGGSTPAGSNNGTTAANPGYVVKIMSGNSVIGTGTVVDNNVIATSAECVYFNNHFPSNLSVVYFDGNGNSERVFTKELHIPVEYMENPGADSNCNYGLIYTEQPSINYSICDMGTVVNSAAALAAQPSVTTFGFPLSNGNNSTTHILKSFTGNISGVLNASKFGTTTYMESTYPGQKGSPVIATTNYTIGSSNRSCSEIVGILSTRTDQGGSYAIRITTSIIEFYLGNSYIDYD